MDVKEVRGGLPSVAAPESTDTAQLSVSETEKRSASSVPAPTTDTVEVGISLDTVAKTTALARINDSIAVVNVADEATEGAHKIVESLHGVASQLATENVAEGRRSILEREAHELAAALQKTLSSAAPNGVKPLAGDAIRLEVEEKLGKALDFFLPDHAQNSLGLATVNVSTKESIIQTQAAIETARRQIEELRHQVRHLHAEVARRTNSNDVAQENRAAAKSTVRDLDSAVELARDTKREITQNPSAAIALFQNARARTATLFE